MASLSSHPSQNLPVKPVEDTAEIAQASKEYSLRDFSMVFALLLICTYFAIWAPGFTSARNLSNLAVELSITAVLALGMLLIILTGHIDLSIGSGVGLMGAAAAVLINKYAWGASPAMALTFFVAIALWVAMGQIIVSQRIPAFIITLAGQLAFKGLHWLVIQNETVPVTNEAGHPNLYTQLTTWYLPKPAGWVLLAVAVGLMIFAQIRGRQRRSALGFNNPPFEIAFSKTFIAGQIMLLFILVFNQFQGIPLSVLILAISAVFVWILTQHTRLGRYLYAVGGNEDAARISGVPVGKVVVAAFGIMGAFVALGGFLQTAYAGSSTTTVGELLELDSIAACVIGGASLKGGRGTVTGVLFGALIMASLMNGMTLMGVSPEMKYIARGIVLALAVWLDSRLAGKG